MKKFDAQVCIKSLGLEEGGAVQQVVDQTVLDVCEPYIPMDIAGGASGGRADSKRDRKYRDRKRGSDLAGTLCTLCIRGDCLRGSGNTCCRVPDRRRLAFPERCFQDTFRQAATVPGRTQEGQPLG